MNNLKSLGSALSLVLLPLMLFSFGVSMSAYRTLSSPEPLKKALDQSGLYDVAIEAFLQQAQQKANAALTAAIPTDRPELQKALNEAVPADLVQDKAESSIDSLYGWLQGKESSLATSFDLSDLKTKVADGVATYADQHLATLPICQAGETTATSDPLNATCVPADFDQAGAIKKIREEITNNPEFLAPQTLQATDGRLQVGDAAIQKPSAIADVFGQARMSLYITGGLVLLSAAGAILCAGTMRNGLKRVGLIALIVGLISAGLAWLGGVVLDSLVGHMHWSDSVTIQSRIAEAVRIFTADARNWWLWYGLVLAGIGFILLVVLRLMRPPKDKVIELPPAPIVPAGDASRSRTTVGSLRTEQSRATSPTTPIKPTYRKGPKIQL